MRNLTEKEIEVVSGGWAANLSDSLEGGITGFGSAAAAGFALGTKIGGSGGGVLGFGLIGSLAGVIVGPIVGGIFGGVGGLLFGEEKIVSIVDKFIDKI